jgi:hypothetical protein
MYVAIFVARDSKGDDWHISHLSSPVSYVYEGLNVPRCIGPAGNAAAARRTSSNSAMASWSSNKSSMVRLRGRSEGNMLLNSGLSRFSELFGKLNVWV